MTLAIWSRIMCVYDNEKNEEEECESYSTVKLYSSNLMVSNQMIWTVLHSTVPMIWTLFEILLLCICFDMMLGLYVLTFTFFFTYETDNKIGDDGAKAIAEALKENTTLAGLDLGGKYHTHSPSFSHDSRFDLASCVCTTIETSFLLQNAMVFNKMTWAVLYFTVSVVREMFEILLLCIYFDVMLGLFVLTFIFFSSCMKQSIRSENLKMRR